MSGIGVTLEPLGRGTHGKIVHLGEGAIAFSYATPIGVFLPGPGWIVRENSWGPTTGGHMNALGVPADERVSETEFLLALRRFFPTTEEV